MPNILVALLLNLRETRCTRTLDVYLSSKNQHAFSLSLHRAEAPITSAGHLIACHFMFMSHFVTADDGSPSRLEAVATVDDQPP